MVQGLMADWPQEAWQPSPVPPGLFFQLPQTLHLIVGTESEQT